MGNIEFQHMNILQSIKSIITKGNGRTALIKKNILASFFIKGISALVQFLLVPLTLSCLGVYENGVWLTISSVLLWIDNLDIGLGNGLRNKLAVYMARKDTEKAREMVSSTFAMLAMIITPVDGVRHVHFQIHRQLLHGAAVACHQQSISCLR